MWQFLLHFISPYFWQLETPKITSSFILISLSGEIPPAKKNAGVNGGFRIP
jgi:hypothetical protein